MFCSDLFAVSCFALQRSETFVQTPRHDMTTRLITGLFHPLAVKSDSSCARKKNGDTRFKQVCLLKMK